MLGEERVAVREGVPCSVGMVAVERGEGGGVEVFLDRLAEEVVG